MFMAAFAKNNLRIYVNRFQATRRAVDLRESVDTSSVLQTGECQSVLLPLRARSETHLVEYIPEPTGRYTGEDARDECFGAVSNNEDD
jgi:hypothetical protein